jgi:hypothetical protein
MRAQASFGLHNPDRCLAGANALAPDLMTADERLTELGHILAVGFMRLRRRQIDERRCPVRRLCTGLLA